MPAEKKWINSRRVQLMEHERASEWGDWEVRGNGAVPKLGQTFGEGGKAESVTRMVMSFHSSMIEIDISALIVD